MGGLISQNMNVHSEVWQVNSEKWTFQDATVKTWVEDKLDGKVLNACAGRTKLKHDTAIHRNDLNEDLDVDSHYDVRNLPQYMDENGFDAVVFDPPWSVYQVNDKYDGRGKDTIKQSTVMANALNYVSNSNAPIITFGYAIDMLPNHLNYKLSRVAVFVIPGPGKDFFGAVHKPKDAKLTQFSEP